MFCNTVAFVALYGDGAGPRACQRLASWVLPAWLTPEKAMCLRALRLGLASTGSVVPLRLIMAAGRSASMAASPEASDLPTATRDA